MPEVTELNPQTDNNSAKVTFAYDDTTSASILDDSRVGLRNLIPHSLVNGMLVGLFLFNPPSLVEHPTWGFPEQGASTVVWQEIEDSHEQLDILTDIDIELDSPNWLSTAIEELQSRGFVRVNDPRNQNN